MRCPKCHYLSFDPEPRCKNCGFDLEVADAELAFKAAEDYSDPIPDLELRRDDAEPASPMPLELRHDPPVSAPAVPKRPRRSSPKPLRARPAGGELEMTGDSTPLPPRSDDHDDAPSPMFRIEPVRETEPLQEVGQLREAESLGEAEPLHELEPVREPEPLREPEPHRAPDRFREPESFREPERFREPAAAREVSRPFASALAAASTSAPAAGVALFDRPQRRRPEPPIEPAPMPPVPAVSAHPTTELPLFVRDASAPPRPPLSVRRTVAEPVRARTSATEAVVHPPARDRRVGPLDRDLLDDLRRVEREEAAFATAEARQHARTRGTVAAEADQFDEDPEDIPPTQRLAAAALDGLLLGGIGSFVLWATLRVTGTGITSLGTDSLVPFVVFLGGVSVAYLLMFTAAGGQTVGKMLMGLRVVGDSPEAIDDQLTMGQAALRAVLAPLSVLALGLGFVPALFGRGLALHDRLAHTRVVRA